MALVTPTPWPTCSSTTPCSALRGVEVTTTEDTIVLNGKTIKTFYDRNPANLPWKEWGVDLVIESTGVFNDDVGASKHFEAGAKR